MRIKQFVALGDGYIGTYDDYQEAKSIVRANGYESGAVYRRVPYSQEEPSDPFDLDAIVEHFRDALHAYLAQGNRAQMIASAAAHAQKMDEPNQRRLAQNYRRNAGILASHDL
jgi:hypothetical protein